MRSAEWCSTLSTLMSDVDDQIAELYRLPLDEFTPARNALAKQLGRPTIKDLQKPNVAAWAVNQLYWKHRPVFERLVRAAERLRTEHRKMLAGKSSDIRGAEKAHRDAIREAEDKAKSLFADAEQGVSQTTMTAIHETLESLPGADEPGQLTRPLKPLGFEALSGVRVRPSHARPALRIVESRADAAKREAAEQKQREKEEKEQQRRVEREKREAQAELARTEAVLTKVQAAVAKAEEALEKLRAQLHEATKAHQRARLRVRN